ncbi:F0F1 ATP synthase subunit epsilon [Rhizobium sp. TH2]|uniref:F0F1 ATP synthase subunit epsilon n=1 Tax=Rhizobium sp. TH2 TaxID=2775403 RepID=UPI0021572C9C|nr:F0F1 ATP synthase subunit epsilon [Rhizobium sp. TH2]UVC08146.1 F0F1 ATP synthase subunit epsilon [Rhizobium sp. TH2]
MAESFNFELVSPEQLLLSAKVTEIVLPGSEGEMTVMANHSPVMTTIRPGVVTVKQEGGETQKFVVFGGFADILPTSCTLLAESALPVAEFRKDALAKRIELAKADLEIVHSDEGKTRAAQLVSDLESLASVAA